MQLRNFDSKNTSQCDIYSGGLIGINLNADIELVSVNYNTSVFYQNAPRQSWHQVVGNPVLHWGTSSFGGFLGAQAVKNGMTFTFNKVTITGGSSSGIVGDDTWAHGDGWGATYGSYVYTQQAALLGSLSGNLPLNGGIIDLN